MHVSIKLARENGEIYIVEHTAVPEALFNGFANPTVEYEMRPEPRAIVPKVNDFATDVRFRTVLHGWDAKDREICSVTYVGNKTD